MRLLLTVGSIIVNGEVNGDINAKQSVEIHAPGKVRGNIATPQLVIAKGVVFEGSCKMEDLQKGASVTLLAKDTNPEPKK